MVDLRMFLSRLRLRPPMQLALPAHSPHRPLVHDAYLSQPQRQGYLDRTRIGEDGSGTGGASQKRGRGCGEVATQLATSITRCGSGWGPRPRAQWQRSAKRPSRRFVAELMAECASGGSGAKGSASDDGGGEVCDEEGSVHRARAHREESHRKSAALLKGVLEHAVAA